MLPGKQKPLDPNLTLIHFSAFRACESEELFHVTSSNFMVKGTCGLEYRNSLP